MFGMEIAAERLASPASNTLPGSAAVFGPVQSAGLVLPVRITCSQEDDVAVVRMNGEVLGVKKMPGCVNLFPCLGAVSGPVQTHAFAHERLSASRAFGTNYREKRSVFM